jgi:hypothetical protein
MSSRVGAIRREYTRSSEPHSGSCRLPFLESRGGCRQLAIAAPSNSAGAMLPCAFRLIGHVVSPELADLVRGAGHSLGSTQRPTQGVKSCHGQGSIRLKDVIVERDDAVNVVLD